MGLKVSVVMITYLHQQYIASAIESVLTQIVNFDVELIISNDCSPDNTSEIIGKYVENHSKGHWIRYFEHSNNMGMRSNFLYAIKQCQGDYLAILDGDDYWTDPCKLQKQVDFLEANEKYSASMHRLKVIYQNKYYKMPILNGVNHDYDGKVEHILSFRLDGTASLIFRKELLTPFFDYFTQFKNADTAIFLVLANQGIIKYFAEPMGVYRRNDQGITNHISFKGYNYFKETNQFLIFSDKYTKFKYSKIILESKLKIMEWIKDERLSILSNLHLKILKKYYHFCLSVNFRLGINMNKYLKL
jgi:glycosyltransferase involved in cell wall biosynthesis